jgi:antirestriction protein ArdC
MNFKTQSVKRDLRQEITDSIIAALEKGIAPWQKPWQAGAFEMPLNPTTGKLYRGGNALHLMITGMRNSFEDPRWITYRQAQENGWQVRKGEKGTQIEFWQFPKNQAEGHEESRDTDPESSRDRFIYRVYTVFNGNQIDGIPAYASRMRQEWEIVQGAEAILLNSGATILHDQPDRAFYNRITDTIHLPPRAAFDSAANYYGTALHETAHWTGAPQRLNRETLNNSHGFGDNEYAKEELRAELASVFLMAERGIPQNPDSHAAYVGSWLASLRDDKNEIFRAARDAHKAADLLLALEHCKTMDQALAHINDSHPSMESQAGNHDTQIISCMPARDNGPELEMEM